jgi:phosphatidyl-myo-inositol dimannoside synthase
MHPTRSMLMPFVRTLSNLMHEPGDNILALLTEAFNGYGGIAQYNCDLMSEVAELPSVNRLEILPRLSEKQGVLRKGKLVQKRAIHNKRLYALHAMVRTIATRPRMIFCGHLFHAPLAAILSKLSGALLVNQLHGTEVWGSLSSELVDALEKSDRILCVSEHTKSVLLSSLSFPEEKILVVPNRVRSSFSPQDRQTSRRHFGVGANPVVLTVGRLDDRGGYKGHDRVLTLMAPLRDRGLVFDYLIVGEGDDRSRLEALAKEQGVMGSVHFLGRVPDEDLPGLYSAADLFALPSTGEGFGIVFIEATACGTPAIGLNVGGASEALCQGELGETVSSGEFAQRFESALVRSLQRTDEDRAKLSALTHTKFGAEVFRDRVETAFEFESSD